ncbi:hypothetical protein PInf_002482 [Phytophthora infestans]|nr:hypothetical protein PInf_002482 [Phytophthora infestans]
MEHAVRLDGERLLGVLESAVRNLELLATLPDRVPASDDFQPPVREALRRQSVIEAGLLRLIEQQSTQQDERPETEEDGDSDADEEELQHHSDETLLLSGPVAVRLFPKSLHQLLRGLKLIISTDAALSTSFEQDERFVLNLRDSMLRLREVEDDRDQVAFELAQAREARLAMSDKLAAQRARLEAQLRETKRAADDILGPTARDREEHLQAALSSFETQTSGAQKQVETIQRTVARVTQASQQVETDERKHTQHAAIELRELIRRYDDDMDKLDAEIEGNDRRNMIEEQRVIDLAERTRRNREANLFGFVLKMQAVVRGFLARKRMGLEAQRKKNRSRKGKKGVKGKKRVNKSPRRKTAKKPSAKARAKKS